MASAPTVVVAVLTYRRPDDLAAILPLLHQQAQDTVAAVQILVVDNDPDGGAEDLVRIHGIAALRYVHEPEAGIAAARNRALAEAGDAELIVFIDDDERPQAHWLSALLATWVAHRPSGVVGPVRSEFSAKVDPWIEAGGFFQRRRLQTGERVDVAATNNLLLDLRRLRAAGITFDTRYGLSGGSDTKFTRQVVAAIGPMVWCAEAVVVDVVPAHRLTRRWVLRRAFRMGNSTSLVAVDLAGHQARARWRTRTQQVGAGLARMLVGTVRLLWGVISGSVAHRAGGMRQCARGAGLVAGAAGHVLVEYRRVARPSGAT